MFRVEKRHQQNYLNCFYDLVCCHIITLKLLMWVQRTSQLWRNRKKNKKQLFHISNQKKRNKLCLISNTFDPNAQCCNTVILRRQSPLTGWPDSWTINCGGEPSEESLIICPYKQLPSPRWGGDWLWKWQMSFSRLNTQRETSVHILIKGWEEEKLATTTLGW